PASKPTEKREARDYPAAAYVAIVTRLEKPARIAFVASRECPIFFRCRTNPPCGRAWRGGGGWGGWPATSSPRHARRSKIRQNPTPTRCTVAAARGSAGA